MYELQVFNTTKIKLRYMSGILIVNTFFTIIIENIYTETAKVDIKFSQFIAQDSDRNVCSVCVQPLFFTSPILFFIFEYPSSTHNLVFQCVK